MFRLLSLASLILFSSAAADPFFGAGVRGNAEEGAGYIVLGSQGSAGPFFGSLEFQAGAGRGGPFLMPQIRLGLACCGDGHHQAYWLARDKIGGDEEWTGGGLMVRPPFVYQDLHIAAEVSEKARGGEGERLYTLEIRVFESI